MAKSPWQYDFQWILESVRTHFVSFLPLTCVSSPSSQTSTSGVVLFFFRTLFFESLCAVSIAKKTHQAELQKRMIHWHREHHYAFLINKYSNLHKMCWQCVHKAEPPQDKWGRRGRCAVKLYLWRAASAGSTLFNVYFVRDVAFLWPPPPVKTRCFWWPRLLCLLASGFMLAGGLLSPSSVVFVLPGSVQLCLSLVS